MSQKKQKDGLELNYRIHDIKIISTEIDDTVEFKENVESPIEVQIGINHHFDLKTSVFYLSLIPSFYINPDSVSPKKLFEVTVQIGFLVKDLKNFIEEMEPIFPKEFWITMLSIGIGSTRGMLASILNQTKYRSLILPPIIPENLFNNNYHLVNSKIKQKK